MALSHIDPTFTNEYAERPCCRRNLLRSRVGSHFRTVLSNRIKASALFPEEIGEAKVWRRCNGFIKCVCQKTAPICSGFVSLRGLRELQSGGGSRWSMLSVHILCCLLFALLCRLYHYWRCSLSVCCRHHGRLAQSVWPSTTSRLPTNRTCLSAKETCWPSSESPGCAQFESKILSEIKRRRKCVMQRHQSRCHWE